MVCVGWLAREHAVTAQAPDGISLEWSAARGCPDREVVLRFLHARMPAQLTDVRLHARAKVVRHGAGYQLDVELDSRSGTASRTIRDVHCEPLAEAAAVLIVLALQSEAAAAEPVAKAAEPPEGADARESVAPTQASRAPSPPKVVPEGEPAEESNDVEPTELISDESPAPTQPRPLRLQLTAAARADFGTFPHEPALGVQAQLAARIRPLYAALGVTYWPAREQRSASYPNARLLGSGLFADFSLGADISALPVVLTPALNVELGQLYAEAAGILGPERNRVLWLAFGPSVSAALSVFDRCEIALEFSGLVPAYRNHWLVGTPEGDVPAFDAASVVLRVALRVGYVLR